MIGLHSSYLFTDLMSYWFTYLLNEGFSRLEKVQAQVGNDQEKAQSEINSHSKNRGGENLRLQLGTYT